MTLLRANGTQAEATRVEVSLPSASTDGYVTVLDDNPKRLGFVITNDGDEVVYLALGEGAEGGYGIRLNANGGSYESNTTNLFTGVVTAAVLDATGGEGYLSVLELIPA